MDDQKSNKIIDLIKFAQDKQTPQDKQKPKKKKSTANTRGIHISGPNNVIGDGNVTLTGDNVTVTGGINIIQNQSSPRKRKTTNNKTPGSISDKQASIIKELLLQWVEAENQAQTELHYRSQPLSHGHAWRMLWKQFGITSYKSLPETRFEEAVKWLKNKKAIAHRVSGASQKIHGWRNSRIRAIKSRCKNQLNNEYAYRPYIDKKFSKTSLADLTDTELELTYNHIRNKK